MPRPHRVTDLRIGHVIFGHDILHTGTETDNDHAHMSALRSV